MAGGVIDFPRKRRALGLLVLAAGFGATTVQAATETPRGIRPHRQRVDGSATGPRTCDAEGLVTPSTTVDHIVPHKGDRTLFWDRTNWQALCKPCHDSKTAREDGRWTGRGGL